MKASHSAKDRWSDLRRLAQTNLYVLAKGILDFKDMDPMFHGPCCAQLDTLRLPFGRQLDLWPRGHLKTHIITIAKNIQYYLQDNNIRIMLGGSSRENSMKNLRKIKQIFETNTLLHWLFPECIPDTKGDKWAEMEILLPRTKNHPESTFKCIGVGGHITGWHFDVLSKDDLIDEKTERSPEVMEKIIDWHLLTKNLLESPVMGIDQVVGTRWAMFDLYQHIINNEREYTVNKISAIQKDERDGILKPVWPARFPMDALLDLRMKDPYMYACQQMNDPRDEAVVDFKASWLQYYGFSDESLNILAEVG